MPSSVSKMKAFLFFKEFLFVLDIRNVIVISSRYKYPESSSVCYSNYQKKTRWADSGSINRRVPKSGLHS